MVWMQSKTSWQSGNITPPHTHTPLTVYYKVLDTVKTLNSINAIHHSGDTLHRFGVLRCVKCRGLLALSIRYGPYMFEWEEQPEKQACVYVGSLQGERGLWL